MVNGGNNSFFMHKFYLQPLQPLEGIQLFYLTYFLDLRLPKTKSKSNCSCVMGTWLLALSDNGTLDIV